MFCSQICFLVLFYVKKQKIISKNDYQTRPYILSHNMFFLNLQLILKFILGNMVKSIKIVGNDSRKWKEGGEDGK